jgi:hypothetical protein
MSTCTEQRECVGLRKTGGVVNASSRESGSNGTRRYLVPVRRHRCLGRR